MNESSSSYFFLPASSCSSTRKKQQTAEKKKRRPDPVVYLRLSQPMKYLSSMVVQCTMLSKYNQRLTLKCGAASKPKETHNE